MTGVNAVVGKPVNWSELEQEIERHLSAAVLPVETAVGSPPVGVRVIGELIDDAALAVLVDSLGGEVLATMLVSCTANMNQYCEDLSAAVSAGDLKQVKRTAHALEGLCAQFGAPRVAALARFIEDQSQNLGEVLPLMPEIKDTVEATAVAFAARRRTLECAATAKAG